MSDRFQELYRIQPNLFIEGSPVLIEAGALLKDTVTDKVLALVKIKNLESKKVTACRVAIRAFGPDGTEMEGLSDYLYVDINAEIGQNFGAKIPVYLPDKNSRKMSVSVTQVVFDDETVWNHEPCEWLQVPEQQYISNYFPDNEFTYQYELEVGPECTFVPVSRNGLFQCTCGATNLAAADRCYHCNRNYEDLVAKMDLDYLADHIAIRQAEEKAAAEAEEARRIAEEKAAEERRLAAEEKRKKQKKIVKVSAIAVALCTVLLLVINTIILPAKKRSEQYDTAIKLMESGSYAEAAEAFALLENYKDAEAKAKECQYDDAKQKMDSKQYLEAKKIFEQLGDYKDSKEQFEYVTEQIQLEKNEANYTKALEFIESKDYESAYNLLNKTKGYKDVDSILNNFYFVPSEVCCKYNSWIKYYFQYDKYGLMKRVYYDDVNCLFNEEGQLSLRRDKYGNTRNYDYLADSILETFKDMYGQEYGQDEYDLNGNMLISGLAFDEHNNVVSSKITNTYDPNGNLTSVEREIKGFALETTVDYRVLYCEDVPDNYEEIIWRNVRLICGERIWLNSILF